ncbi:hypothetical protein MNBD_CHLOROFLEXI01-1995 [hydrothermal vent metagenome]|uniref:Uncharacterized protein n=1 Tax=hydrothermal vent metagenome TaxID=652676 RepID=A0A3B0URL1_9ZZZZ
MTVDVIRYLPEEKLVQKALEALMAALGPVEATRFLTLSREGRLESVARHHQWQATLDQEAFFNEVFKENAPD